MIASPMCFFRDLYSKLRASWCSIRDAKNTLVMSKRSAEKKSARRGNQLVKQELVTVSKKSHLIHNRYQINRTFSRKTFTADPVRLTCTKLTGSLAHEG